MNGDKHRLQKRRPLDCDGRASEVTEVGV
jgi:hypothetical protein